MEDKRSIGLQLCNPMLLLSITLDTDGTAKDA